MLSEDVSGLPGSHPVLEGGLSKVLLEGMDGSD